MVKCSDIRLAEFCRSPCRERGLKCPQRANVSRLLSRSPCGERGLKSPPSGRRRHRRASLPVRGAWIEIFPARVLHCARNVAPRAGSVDEIRSRKERCRTGRCRSPCGERGLKWTSLATPVEIALCHSPCGERGLKFNKIIGRGIRGNRRSPCGERGLKFHTINRLSLLSKSLPVRGAWIEITIIACNQSHDIRRSPCGERGLKSGGGKNSPPPQSRSPCGERGLKCVPALVPVPALCRSPCGERGLKSENAVKNNFHYRVAPRAGSVD